MEKYRYDPEVLKQMEACCVPFAVYQFIDKRVVTVALTQGFLDLFGFDDRAAAYDLMDTDMYRDVYPEDKGPIADAAYRFATEGGHYNVIYRTRRRPESDDYVVVHAHGEHVFADTGERLAVVWYADEGDYDPEMPTSASGVNLSGYFSKMIREEGIVRKSYYDALTGLPRMAYFFELAGAARSEAAGTGKELCFLFFDLCGMRNYNHKFGFSEGDKLLVAFANLLTDHFSNENCARLAQDFFSVITYSDDIVERVKRFFAEARNLNGGRSLPVRAGIYHDSFGEVEVAEAIDRAKMACDTKFGSYASVYTVFKPSMLEASANRQYILDNFDTALEKEYIQVYYQPVIRSASGHVCHEEALARWIDPVKGFMSPGEFVPVLEDSRLIYKLDLYVLEQTIRKMKRVRAEGLYVVPSSINLSRSDFDMCDIVEEVRSIVDSEGVPRKLIVIEITESIIGSDFEYMKEQVERFRALGFSVWMDDFGSGYSSLDVLQSIQFDAIKLDMRFMQQFSRSDNTRIILTELIRMASGLGLRTIAEGVEKPEQISFLKEIGCNMLQGFYFCKPISLDALLERYAEGRQIGFENPDQVNYYSAIGSINLYDPISVASEDIKSFAHYFDTMPSAIMEVSGDVVTIVRRNRSYKDFMKKAFGVDELSHPTKVSELEGVPGHSFLQATVTCAEDGQKRPVFERLPGGGSINALIRRIAVDPVTGTAAIAVVVLSVE